MLQLRIFFCRECCIYVLFCRECRDYALFDVEFYAEFLEEILRNTQNFGRKSAEKVGRWSLWVEEILRNKWVGCTWTEAKSQKRSCWRHCNSCKYHNMKLVPVQPQTIYQHRPADGAADSAGGEVTCQEASRLVRRGQVDLEGAENVTKISVTKMIEFQL